MERDTQEFSCSTSVLLVSADVLLMSALNPAALFFFPLLLMSNQHAQIATLGQSVIQASLESSADESCKRPISLLRVVTQRQPRNKGVLKACCILASNRM